MSNDKGAAYERTTDCDVNVKKMSIKCERKKKKKKMFKKRSFV